MTSTDLDFRALISRYGLIEIAPKLQNDNPNNAKYQAGNSFRDGVLRSRQASTAHRLVGE